ncbi:MAG: class I SAM-dependent methyltransferase [Verrucomicrobiota bacterium]|jgi:SAM-dependent methyltransferase|nr:class I SAM-dependent methyltransferase [Verrucomicrobiota bacterium]MDP7179082.1 class I SAM-dependent methyltransferase [Verrucomicrobiota bacterium]MDP7442467.1 class I SAM-dependent methyltransferase [Verrucomicrobiota bacterium]MDP7584439.1 class I SAM-dependent methyltransferase [Verrucomicrobiota bacterium]
MTEPLRQTAERTLRRFAPPLYRWLQRCSGQRLARRFATAEERFRHIYETNHWSEAESVSGPGSTLEETEPIRRELPALLGELGATSLLDLPCGDFHWMQHTDLAGIDYIGGDLVGELIERNQAQHAHEGINFRKLDLVRDTLPTVDAVLCRDCLVHLSFGDAQAALANVARSRVKWLLTTSFPGVERNDDIVTGQWRPLNLMLPPFNLPEPAKRIAENCTESEFAGKLLGVWPVADLPQAGCS